MPRSALSASLFAVALLSCSAAPAAADVCADLAPHLAAGAQALTGAPAGGDAFTAYRAVIAAAARAAGAADAAAAVEALAPGRAIPAAEQPLAGCLLRGYLEARYGHRFAPDLQTIVGFRTYAEEGRANWDAPEFGRQRQWLAARAAELGLAFKSFDGRVEEISLPAALASPILAVLTHGDVQGVEGQRWSSPPWEGRLVDDRIIGRGTEDDKGPIVATLYALAALRDTGWPRASTIKLLVANGEESSWEEIPYYLERAPAPAMTLGVDAAYPVTHAQKGFGALTVRAGGAGGTGEGQAARAEEADSSSQRQAGEAASGGEGDEGPEGDADHTAGEHAHHGHDHAAQPAAEPATKPAPSAGRVRVLRMSGGSGLSIIPERGEALLEVAGRSAEESLPELERLAAAWAAAHPPARLSVSREGEALKLVAEGRGGHSSVPASGHNALGDLTAFLATFDLVPDPWGRLAAFLGNVIGTETDGRTLGVALHDEVIGDLTVNLATIAEEDGHPTAAVNLRVPRGLTAEQIGRRVAARASLAGESTPALTTDFQLFSEPHLVPAEGPLVSTLLAVWEEVTGAPGRPVAIGGGTQARLFPGGVDFGPALDMATYRGHGTDEYLTPAELRKIAALTATALLRLSVLPRYEMSRKTSSSVK